MQTIKRDVQMPDTARLAGSGTRQEMACLAEKYAAIGAMTHFEFRCHQDGTDYGDLYAATPEWVENYKRAGGLWY